MVIHEKPDAQHLVVLSLKALSLCRTNVTCSHNRGIAPHFLAPRAQLTYKIQGSPASHTSPARANRLLNIVQRKVSNIQGKWF